MKKEKFIIYCSTLITAIVITMFISSIVTFISIKEPSLFWSVWPKNWFYATLVAFPTIIIVRPIALNISKKLSNLLYHIK